MIDDHLERLAKLFLKFPGIGARQAKRFAYFILTQEPSYVDALSKLLTTARSLANTCIRCQRIFEGKPGLCTLCADEHRDKAMLLVVEKSQDIESFAKTDYHGLFFVLGGLIPIVQKNVVAGTNLQKLLDLVQHEHIQEIILAFPVTPNGEHTDTVVRETLARTYLGKISSLGRGLSTGAELEYADAASLIASLKGRE